MKKLIVAMALTLSISSLAYAGAWKSFENDNLSVATTPSEKYSDMHFVVAFDKASRCDAYIRFHVRGVDDWTAGERVYEIDGNSLAFAESGNNTMSVSRYGHIRGWWDLKSSSGHETSSGTYWVKIHARVTPHTTNLSQDLSTLAKFVVVR